MSLETGDIMDIFTKHKDDPERWIVFAITIATEVKTKTYDIKLPLAHITIMSMHPTRDDALRAVIIYMDSYKHLRFEVARMYVPHPIGLQTDETLVRTTDQWKHMTIDYIAKMEADMRDKQAHQDQIFREIEVERTIEDDPTSIEYFRTNFFNICKNKEYIKSRRTELDNIQTATTDRIEKCMKYIDTHPTAIADLIILFRERLDRRGESQAADYLISKLKDVNSQGIPTILTS